MSLVCLRSARWDGFRASGAEEGRDLILDRGKERNTLTVDLDHSFIMLDDRAVCAAANGYDRLCCGRGRCHHAGTRRCAQIAALTPIKVAIRVRRTKFGPVIRGRGGPRSRLRT
jgi:hypothetical protein